MLLLNETDIRQLLSMGDLSETMESALAEFSRTGFATFAADWIAFDRLQGHSVRVEQAHGHRDGVVRGIDRDGALLLETAETVERILSGDIRVRRLEGTGA